MSEDFFYPYKVEGRLFPAVQFQGDNIYVYGPFGYFEARKMADNLNTAFQMGMMQLMALPKPMTQREFFAGLAKFKK